MTPATPATPQPAPMTTHTRHAKTVGKTDSHGNPTCNASDITFGGLCLNCGFTPTPATPQPAPMTTTPPTNQPTKMSLKYITGNKLHPDVQKHVLAAFVHRFTGNHIPTWVAKARENGQPYPLAFANDSDWLANTKFAVRKDGQLDCRAKFCLSNPTWPLNPELRNQPPHQ